MSYENYLDIDVDGADELREKLKDLGKDAPKAMYRAINDAAKTARTVMDRNVRGLYFVKQKDVLETLKISKAHSNKLNAFIYSKGSAIALSKFKTTPTKVPKKRKKPIAAGVMKDGGAKPLDGNPKAFLASFSTGHNGVMTRVSDKRYPIKQLYGPAAPSMIKNEEIMSNVKEQAARILAERLDHHIEFLLSGR